MELVNQGFVRCGELVKAMTPGARLLAALSLAIAVGSLVWLFGQHVVPGHTYLMGGESFSVTQLRDMESALGQAGLTDYQIDGARIRVPSGHQSKYMAALAEGGALPADFGEYLRKAVDTNGFMMYGSRQEAQLKVAVQSELQGLINNFHGIERSFVQIAEESNQGFSRTKSVTASVGVQPSKTEVLNERTVSAIRMIVASAWGGLKPENVTVVDTSCNRPFYGPLNSNGPGGGEYVENKKQIELDWQEKIARVLGIAGAVVTSSVELESDGRTPRRVSISVAVPATHFATLWQQHHGLPPVAGRVRPDAAAFAAFERSESERIKQAIAPLLSSTDAAVDRNSLVAVSTIYAPAAPLSTAPRPEEVALAWLVTNWQNVGLGALVVVALLLMRSTFRTAAKPVAKSAIDELAESLYFVADDAPTASSSGGAASRAPVPPPHTPPSAWQSELADRVRQDPQAAASVLRTWIKNAS
jgi:flagellar biosynthesis/type III secretory pathway M-ring protein FliF/YscJ